MRILEYIVRKKVLVSLLSVLIIALGGAAVLQLDKEIMPSIGMDGAFVNIDAGELSAIDVERTITSPLEQKIQVIEGIQEVQSKTHRGESSLQITFERGRGEELSKKVHQAVTELKAAQPEIKDVYSSQYGVNQGYEFYMDITGGDMEMMPDFAKDVLKPRLEGLREVADVNLSGLPESEVAVQFKRDELIKHELDISQVTSIIAEANSEATLGELTSDYDNATVRWNTKLESVASLKQLEIPTIAGTIRLDDIAAVSLVPLEGSSFVWKNGTQDLVFVQISRASNVNQIDMAKAIRAEVEKIREEGFIDGFTLNEMVAQADFVKESIDGITVNILIGSIVAVAILLVFLRNIRATLIIGVSIPTSVLLTFLTVYLLGYSLNVLTLIGLGLGIGMMVDSSIVILESIYRQRELGLGNLESVLTGTKEVAGAVFASMLTTIVVFLPIGFIGGDLGRLMIILSIVIAITLISSVIVAFTVIPTLSEKFLRFKKKDPVAKEGFITKGYSAAVSWIVRKKKRSVLIIGLFSALFVGSLFLVPIIPMTVMPDIFNRYTEVVIELESGIHEKDKAEVMTAVNERLESIQDVESNYLLDTDGLLIGIINMTKGDDIHKNQKEVNEEILKRLRELVPSTPITSVQSAMDGLAGSPVQVIIKGDDFDTLQTLSDKFKQKLDAVDGIVGITDTMQHATPEQVIVLKEKAIQDAGLSALHVKQFLEQTFFNAPIGQITIADQAVPIIASWDAKTTTADALLNLRIPTTDGEKKLFSFIDLKTVQTPNEIMHKDGDRYITVSADIEKRDLGAIHRDVQRVLKDFNTPNGYTVGVAGDIEQQQELMMEMIVVLAIALFLVYFVMAVQFNHLGHPFIVMSIIPMAIIGVIIGLVVTQRELNLLSGMGIIMLIGIVLNNAILLIDRTNQLRTEGQSVDEALVAAGKQRIRPIQMTTLTTVGGMLPLALASGVSGNYQAPLATVLIFGLLFSTIITLLLIPAVYRVFTVSKIKSKTE
ncbi:efflux RND transporter permease subunit [Sporosarcina jeotgali]|uniref:Efflux RND transporter permease subunit n=1 Tax=Sporosarcina jeotgali TaxID=3020056 RepID=A0ABZ0KV64_9BACL|nr:efflux RND transporter permease subunit [Sporosarcina sp. B2O-1]WOV84307.1 efflux RND transporter permease subunit [Sporosarcina sp. B2O-1]